MRRLAASAGLLLLAGQLLVGMLRAQDAPGTLRFDPPPRDLDFGVAARAAGLERRVEMLQWTRTAQGYARAWSDEPIDASRFAPGHANPVDWPLPARRWLARSVTLDGRPLDPAVIAALGTWQDIRPSFDALPGNMAATFQPEGDGLGSADNPLDPQVGDLRIRWRALALPPLQGRVVLRDGRWELAPDPGDEAGNGVRDGAGSVPRSVAAPARPLQRDPGRTRWPWLLAALAGGLAAIFAARGRRKH
ncbi:MAG TPA: TMEM43 family protein [Xanthomonadaceae bacterium]|nr:TMEM43 family protein [Xanthomonadaceae bacterium]